MGCLIINVEGIITPKLPIIVDVINPTLDIDIQILPTYFLNLQIYNTAFPLTIGIQHNQHNIDCTISAICEALFKGVISVETAEILIDYVGTETTVPVYSNVDWIVRSDDPLSYWLNISYSGHLEGTATFSALLNEGIDRGTTVIFESVDKNTIVTVPLIQEGLREIYVSDFELKDGGTFNVLKQ